MQPLFLAIPVICCCVFLSILCAVYAIQDPTFGGMFPNVQSQGLEDAKKAAKKTDKKAKGKATPVPVMPYEIPADIRTDCPPGKRGVIGYEHEIRGGKSYMWCYHDSGRGSGISHIGNDKLSYLSIPPGMKVTVYENSDMGGLYKTFEAGEWDLRQHKFDWSMYGQPKRTSQLEDRASSLKIEGVPVNATPTGTAPSFVDMNRGA